MRFIYVACCFLLFFSFSESVKAQEEPIENKQRMFLLDAGIQTFYLQDEYASNLNYSGTSSSFNFIYRSITHQKSLQQFSIKCSFPKLTNNFTSSTINGIEGHLSYQYLLGIKSWSLFNSNLYLGPILKLNVFSRNGEISSSNQKNSVLSGELFTSFGPAIFISKHFNHKHEIAFNLNFGLISYLINRESFYKDGSDFKLPNKLFDYNFGMRYVFNTSKDTLFNLSYQFYYNQIDNNAFDLHSGGHIISLGLVFKLKTK